MSTTKSVEQLLTQVKDRFLAACREVLLSRLRNIRLQYPEIDPDILVELVLLTGIGYLNRMTKQEGREHVAQYLSEILSDLTRKVCKHDPGIVPEIGAAVTAMTEMLEEGVQGQSEPAVTTAKVYVNDLLPGVGLFGMWNTGREN